MTKNPIFSLAILKKIGEDCDSNIIQAEAAMWLVSHLMKKSASQFLEARLSAKKFCATGLHDERLSNYV